MADGQGLAVCGDPGRAVTPGRWRQLERIFPEALEREGAERDLFLKTACQGDPELYEEARRLLVSHERAAGFLSDPAIALSSGDDPPSLFAPGQVIAARFRIVRFIARGGSVRHLQREFAQRELARMLLR